MKFYLQVLVKRSAVSLQQPASATPACAAALLFLLLSKVEARPLHTIAFHSIAEGLSWSCAASGRRCPARGTVHRIAFLVRLAYLHCIPLFRSGLLRHPRPQTPFHVFAIASLHCFIPFRRSASLAFRHCSVRRASSILCAPPAGHPSAAPCPSVCNASLAIATLSHMH
jgi:hypothetical protein